MNAPMNDHSPARYGRRDALRIGGLTVSIAALAAACGDDRGGDTAAGRVGYAPPATDLADYPVDDAVMLRTASSLELTTVAVYEAALDSGKLDGNLATLLERLVENHRTTADQMGTLTEAVGGVAWTCTNPWFMDRLVEPLLAAIADSDDPARDFLNTAVALEDIGAATHQSLTTALTDATAAAATIAAATLESRHSAAIAATVRGADGYVDPVIGGREAQNDADGVPLVFAISGRFGSTGQVDLVVGKPNENGVRQTFALQTPSLNAWIYNELEPTC